LTQSASIFAISSLNDEYSETFFSFSCDFSIAVRASLLIAVAPALSLMFHIAPGMFMSDVITDAGVSGTDTGDAGSVPVVAAGVLFFQAVYLAYADLREFSFAISHFVLFSNCWKAVSSSSQNCFLYESKRDSKLKLSAM